MRRIALLLGLGSLLFACTPSPESACVHWEELDQADPMPKYGETPKRARPSKKSACIKGLQDLKTVDPKASESGAKCLGKAKTSSDAWNCWVFHHISDKQPERKAQLIECDRICEDARATRCLGGVTGKCNLDPSCVEACSIQYEDCITRCQFE